ncbi:uncharacterized protein F5147DRAFT_725294, partial [Suillus discolor]
EQSLRDQDLTPDRDASGLAQVITLSKSFMSSTAKAKTAKLIRTLLNYFNSIPNSQQTQIDVLTNNIEWSKREKHIFLNSLEIRLISLLDDKMILTKVHLLESRVYRGIGNLSKSKAAITSARTAANSIYCPPHLQAALDLQSGVLHAEDKDYATAYSYFYETFKNMSSQDDPAALNALEYMLLCKVMLNMLRKIESMRAIALAHQNRNLSAFEKALQDYKHEIDCVAKQVGREPQDVEAKCILNCLCEK